MKDKEIIIDGIDVSGCKELQTVVNEEPFCDSSNTLKILCRGNNCIYKQLKRLEAENERLKEKNFDYNIACTRLEEYGKCLKQTLQEIKKIAERAFAVCDDDCGNANKFTDILEVITKAESVEE